MSASPEVVGTREGVQESLRLLLAGLFEMAVAELTVNTRFNEDLGMDSLHVLALVAELEDRAGVQIDVYEIAEIATVGQVVDLTLDALALAAADGAEVGP